jgi:bacterial/archaeal transporter family-2 protein
VGTLVLGAVVLLVREGVPALCNVADAPWWAWMGVLGAFYIAASVILTHPDPQNRTANTVTFIIPGKVLASIILDRFGLLNLPVHPVSPVSLARIGGAALVIAGVLVVLRT